MSSSLVFALLSSFPLVLYSLFLSITYSSVIYYYNPSRPYYPEFFAFYSSLNSFSHPRALMNSINLYTTKLVQLCDSYFWEITSCYPLLKAAKESKWDRQYWKLFFKISLFKSRAWASSDINATIASCLYTFYTVNTFISSSALPLCKTTCPLPLAKPLLATIWPSSLCDGLVNIRNSSASKIERKPIHIGGLHTRRSRWGRKGSQGLKALM
jgi:hypothetical protein